MAAGDSCKEGTLRVVSGESGKEGRVELCHNQLWGAIMDREWNLSKAAVVCRERGYEPAGEFVHTVILQTATSKLLPVFHSSPPSHLLQFLQFHMH